MSDRSNLVMATALRGSPTFRSDLDLGRFQTTGGHLELFSAVLVVWWHMLGHLCWVMLPHVCQDQGSMMFVSAVRPPFFMKITHSINNANQDLTGELAMYDRLLV